MLKRRFPWFAWQDWQDILFLHTPVQKQMIREMVPAPFTIDTFDGSAWVSMVLFQATKSQFRNLPAVLAFPSFYQMNLRTYVQFGRERGVYFFSIYTNNPLATIAGKMASLPFQTSPISLRNVENHYCFSAKQLSTRQNGMLELSYTPQSTPFKPNEHSLDHFLTERYCIWMRRNHQLVKAPISHKHWYLQKATTTIHQKQEFEFPLSNDTFSHYASYKHAMIHPFEKVGKMSPPTML